MSKPIWNLDYYRLLMAGFSQAEMGQMGGINRNTANGRALQHIEQCEADNRDLMICKEIDDGRTDREIGLRHDIDFKHVSKLRRELGALDVEG